LSAEPPEYRKGEIGIKKMAEIILIIYYYEEEGGRRKIIKYTR